MNILAVIAVINQMVTDGVIARYAIGGAVGAAFYLEPVATLDVGIFVSFRPETGRLIVNPQPIFDYLAARGHVTEGEYVMVFDSPVQFLPPMSPLVEEALDGAVARDIDGVPTRVFTAEHLAAIALQTGRSKDKARLLQFVEEAAIDTERFHLLLARHGLVERWQHFQRQFLDDLS